MGRMEAHMPKIEVGDTIVLHGEIMRVSEDGRQITFRLPPYDTRSTYPVDIVVNVIKEKVPTRRRALRDKPD